jgi:hypothetical protein
MLNFVAVYVLVIFRCYALVCCALCLEGNFSKLRGIFVETEAPDTGLTRCIRFLVTGIIPGLKYITIAN